MGALFESVASALGRAGGGYAAARDTAIEQRNQAEEQGFAQAQRVREFLEQQRVDALNQQVQQALMKSRAAGNIVDLGASQDDKGQWSRRLYNLETGQTMTMPMGTPESVARENALQQSELDRATQLEDQRQRNRDELEDRRARFRKDEIRLRGSSKGGGGSLGAVPLAIQRWYKVLGGDKVDLQIRMLEQKLAAEDKLAVGVSVTQLYPDYPADQQRLLQLYDQHDQIMQQASARVPGGGGATSPQPASPKGAGTSSSPIVVTPEDMGG